MMAGLHEHSCDSMALDVDLSRTAAVAEALSLADAFNGGRRGGGGGAYVPACLMAAAAAARRGAAGGGAQLSGQLRWPRAQVGRLPTAPQQRSAATGLPPDPTPRLAQPSASGLAAPPFPIPRLAGRLRAPPGCDAGFTQDLGLPRAPRRGAPARVQPARCASAGPQPQARRAAGAGRGARRRALDDEPPGARAAGAPGAAHAAPQGRAGPAGQRQPHATPHGPLPWAGPIPSPALDLLGRQPALPSGGEGGSCLGIPIAPTQPPQVDVLAEYGLNYSFPAAADPSGPPTAGGAGGPGGAASCASHGCGQAAALLGAISAAAAAAAAAAESGPGGGGGGGGGGPAAAGAAAAAGGPAAGGMFTLPRPAPLAPPLDLLDCYSGLPDPVGRGEVPLVVRQLVARGVQEAALRRLEQVRGQGASVWVAGDRRDGQADVWAKGEGAPARERAALRSAAVATCSASPLCHAGIAGLRRRRRPPPPPGQARLKEGAPGPRPSGAAAAGAPPGAAAAAKAPVAGPVVRRLEPRAPLPEVKRRGCWLDDLKQRKASSKRSAAVAAAGGAPGAGADGGGAAGVKASGPGSHVVLYRYNEGYTNAVKRPLLVHELLD
jgi:hypothetical protein